MSKVLEVIMKNQMIEYVCNNNLLYHFQSGFRAGHSTTSALLKVVHAFQIAIDKQQIGNLLLLDFSKAFDTVDHALLCQKLSSQFKFCSMAVKMVANYLSGRKQCVLMSSFISDMLNVNCCVHQGSVLEPILFSLFINDFHTVTCHIYAHDAHFFNT